MTGEQTNFAGPDSRAQSPTRQELNEVIALREQGQYPEMAELCARLAERYPAFAPLRTIEGAALLKLGQLEHSLASYDAALRIHPSDIEALCGRGNVLRALRRPGEALDSLDEAVRLRPDSAEIHRRRGNVHDDLEHDDQALASYDKAIALQPDLAAAHNDRGNVLLRQRHLQQAIASYETALRVRPDFAAAHDNRGIALQYLGLSKAALACHDRAIALTPDFTDAHLHRGVALGYLKRFDEAMVSYEEVLRLRPGCPKAAGQIGYLRMQLCDWRPRADGIDPAHIALDADILPPFALLSVDDDPALQLERARAWRTSNLPPADPPLARPAARPERLRIGYFSADYHVHAVMFLIVRLFELHDKERFELHAFSLGADQQDPLRKRAAAAFDQFHDVRGLTDPEVAALARRLGIDVAVDLSGYTRGARSAIFAHRAAPVQINYLGYPGSMGAEFIDYILADRVVAPPESRRFFDETVIALPHCYQANDDQRPISERSFTRAELGLPEHSFVFCCFNNNYKISPAEFDIWMRLLGKVEGSVLWLLETNRWVRANLEREAHARGVDPDRLVFASKMPNPDHLARHRCADLFLDTFAYNAHTTGSDALWAGLPMVTRLGRSFPARVGASLLEATGMGELVTHSAAEYEALALALARDPARLAAIRTKLAAQLPGAPLFDSRAFARDVERAYDLAFARCVAGLPPDHIDIAEASRGAGAARTSC